MWPAKNGTSDPSQFAYVSQVQYEDTSIARRVGYCRRDVRNRRVGWGCAPTDKASTVFHKTKELLSAVVYGLSVINLDICSGHSHEILSQFAV